MLYAARQATLDAAFFNMPERFLHKPPKPPKIPTAVWINPPNQTEKIQA
jgi:putative transposase